MTRTAPGPKRPKTVSKAMRREARGKDCNLQLPGICNHNPETTVLAHLRFFGWAGMAEKPADYLAVFACSNCHDVLDGKNREGRIDGWDVVRALGDTLQAQERAGNYGALK